MKKESKNIGFVSTRFAGTDGVSLETEKWAAVIEKEGHSCFYLAGECDRPPGRSLVVDEANFADPVIERIQEGCFNRTTRDPAVTREVHAVAERLKERLYAFVGMFGIDLLITENALTIPMNIPLGIALTEFIAETGFPTIAHHHDFFWERPRFLTNAVWDYLNMAFPPNLHSIRHVVINSSGDHQLGLRTGISSTVIPNVMDFENSPPPPDDYARDVREALGIAKGEAFVLQPTRVVKRKGIEHAIELVKRLGVPAKLVISHAGGDEGSEYERRVRDYSALMGVNTLFVSDIIGERRGTTPDGRKIYTLGDIYPHADIVTYPSTIEGFGNAFLEAIYYRRPIVVNTYSIYLTDIKPKGFRVITMNGYVTDRAVRQTREVLENAQLGREMAERNYELGKVHYSYSVLTRKLSGVVADIYGL